MVQVNVTALLRDLSQGHPGALDRLMPILYDELRAIARGQLRRERPGHTLDSTGLIHETYIRLLEINRVEWQDRHHFIAVAARVMRRVLIDYARARTRAKRVGGAAFVTLGAAAAVPELPAEDLLELEESLARLEVHNERACRVVECRCFGGLSVEETAQALSISPATVKRDWVFSRAWLNRELGQRASGTPAM